MAETIEIYKDMGRYVLCKTVELRNGQLFVRMKKLARMPELGY